MIRKMYFDEWMRFRKMGEAYDGLWKGIIYNEPIRPKVDFKREPDWMTKYPDLWPTCQILRDGKPVEDENLLDSDDDWSEVHSNSDEERRYRLEKVARKEKKAARRRWLEERKKHVVEEEQQMKMSQKEKDRMQREKMKGLDIVIQGHNEDNVGYLETLFLPLIEKQYDTGSQK